MTLVGGAAIAGTRGLAAQPSERPVTIGMLMGYAENDEQGTVRIATMLKELQRLGWTEGRNLRIEYRRATDDARHATLMAKELVRLQPDVLVVHTTPMTAALVRETRTIPIVFVTVTDPVGDGFVASMSRPGGNVTGFANYEPSLAGKWVEVLKDIAPHVSRLAILFNPETAPGHGSHFNGAIESAAASVGVTTFPAPARSLADIENVFAGLAREPGGGLITTADLFIAVNRQAIIALADRYRVPAIYPGRFFVALGGLVSYGIDTIDLFRRAASYIDRILRGAKPSDLPVQGPVKFELLINRKTAHALGLTVPRRLLIGAEVLE
jgi:putative ABC transport system substrate-binding protein